MKCKLFIIIRKSKGKEILFTSPLDSYRLETQNRLGSNQDLSLTGYEPKIREKSSTNKITQWALLKEGLMKTAKRFETSHHSRNTEDGVDETTRNPIDTTRQTTSTRPKGRSSILRREQTTSDWQAWTSRVGAKTNHASLATYRRKHPSCNHPLRTTDQMISGCKAGNLPK